MAQNTPTETLALLTRLAQKPGVTATLILSRSTGAVVRATGLDTTPAPAPATAAEPALPAPGNGAPPADEAPPIAAGDAPAPAMASAITPTPPHDKRLRSAEDVARVVWRFFQHAGDAVAALGDVGIGSSSGGGGGGGGGGELRDTGMDKEQERESRLSAGAGAGAGAGDEVKLVRLRTRRNELVVLPDAKFLLVVVHDTPLA